MANARRLEVAVNGRDPAGRRTHQRISTHATEDSAFTRIVEIMKQWGDSHGAIKTGTEIAIVDMADGGKVFTATYLGYEPDLLSGR